MTDSQHQIDDRITCCEFSPNGTLLAVSSVNGSMDIYKSQDLSPIIKFQKLGFMNQFTWNDCGYILLCARNDGKAILADIKTKTIEILYDPGEEKHAVCIASSPRLFAAIGYSDGTISIIVRKEVAPSVFSAGYYPVTSIAVMNEKNSIIVTSSDGIVRIFNFLPTVNPVTHHYCISSIYVKKSPLYQIKLLNNDDVALILAPNCMIRLLNLSKGPISEPITMLSPNLNTKQFKILNYNDKSSFVACISDGSFKILSIDTLAVVLEKPMPNLKGFAISCHPTSPLIATAGSGDQPILLHNVTFA
ncbi:hypothetical protein TVAG_227330 [Trichomonas vaginalis G3]|uniref:Anaphase-promoting complex subunit 4 WD40 domain-containing protein n=1 Tax=Trichomonas vaginalis (strain ATCC PRA-98 / G3) TaxID=412133 RepID=A2GHT6_TRIV3|nr:WD40 repeat-like family [Trichomonas vaginalis G3]EAX83281.1 hypothetical protein TVAG_227330 [Trichomonas vaginalis G3]KAI5496587.1 WD40 repeat-like family [Trichomonas vaginalis G3]|eukprot:XP_001296211.1 hypothetical protein [Trichomonas vaginalis G3]